MVASPVDGEWVFVFLVFMIHFYYRKLSILWSDVVCEIYNKFIVMGRYLALGNWVCNIESRGDLFRAPFHLLISYLQIVRK